VRLHTKGVKRLNHPIVGELELHYDRLDLMADRLMLFVYTAEPGSRSAEWPCSRADGVRWSRSERSSSSPRALGSTLAPEKEHA
jgi:MmyB-like transcription regulator ligand binding domain